jgi:hypothetical protein
MRLLLITGAGASRDLAYEGNTLPLMPNWSNALCEALDQRHQRLAASCWLTRDAAGPDFEKNLGLLLQWRRALPLAERFQQLGGNQPGEVEVPYQGAIKRMADRLDTVMDALNTTLYAEFGNQKIDVNRAHDAYQALLHQLLGDPDLVIATTNYDRSAEIALRRAGREVTTGFEPDPDRTPTLAAAGLIRAKGDRIVVLHLHGCVGWYERDGQIEDHYGDREFNAALGSPVVLYPDPNKNPTSDAAVSQLWQEFSEALDWADHVLVLGHSLNDQALVREMSRRVQGDKKLAVGYLTDEGRENVTSQFSRATPVFFRCAPEPECDEKALAGWASET